MKRRRVFFITIGIVLIALAGGGIFVKYQLDNLLNQSDMLLVDKEPVASTQSGSELSTDWTKDGSNRSDTLRTTKANSSNIQTDSGGLDREYFTAGIEKKADQPVESKDLVKAGIILMHKLSAQDINYLNKIARKGTYTREEYLYTQEILHKLSPTDIDTLKQLGNKYGIDSGILKPEA